MEPTCPPGSQRALREPFRVMASWRLGGLFEKAASACGSAAPGLPRHLRLAFLAAVLALAGCKSFRSSNDPIVRDQEIVRDIKWQLQKEPRFAEVLVACEGRVVTLTGRVTSAPASADAEKLAAGTRDVGRVVNKVEVKPK